MTDGKPANKYGATPGKLALIGALSIALVFVVYRNFFSGSADSIPSAAGDGDVAGGERASRPRGGAHDKDSEPGPNPVDRLASRLRSKPWPSYPLAEIGDYDPLALPSAFPQPREAIAEENGPMQTPDAAAAALAAKRAEMAAARAAAIAAIRQQGVQVIFSSADEFVALIGDREVRVGDEVAGFIVVDIGTDGVTLEGMKVK